MSNTSKFGVVVLALAMAQFIITVDTTIMNVSVPQLVEDLDTTVGSVQAAITLFALIMASFMLIGGKLGELYGRKKMFLVGLVTYGIGSVVTALSPNIYVLIFGWSILEGIGASLMMPAMMALITQNFKGPKRTTALGITAGVAGAAAALGPIIGGALTTYATWRWAFIGEAVVAVITLFLSRYIIDNAKTLKERLDIKGATLAASGLAVFVIGLLQASTYGWIRAVKPFEIGDISLELLGFSIVPFICGIGVLILYTFFKHEKATAAKGEPVLLNTALLKIVPLRSGLSVILITQLALAGALFTMPLFLQLVLDFTAMQAGIALLPLSVALVLASSLGGKLSRKHSEIKVTRLGQILVLVGFIVLITNIDNEATTTSLIPAFALLGAGIGLILPSIQSIILASGGDKSAAQTSGLFYTYQQLGTSLGTAVIGSVLLFSLGGSFVRGLGNSAVFDQSLIEENSVAISSSVEFVSDDQLLTALESSDLSQNEKDLLFSVNQDARLRALKVAIGAAAIVTLIGLGASGRVEDSLVVKGQS